MKPKPTIGLGITENQYSNIHAMKDEEEEMGDKRKQRNENALQGIKNAAPLNDFVVAWFTAYQQGKDSGYVVEYLESLDKGYSVTKAGVKARASRIRKRKKNPIHLGFLKDERQSRGLTASAELVNKAMEAGDLKELKRLLGR